MNQPKRKPLRGFTLVELLIVIAVIAILASLAIPNMISSRKAANEASAIQSLRAMSSAQEAYRVRQNPPTYAAGIDVLLAAGGIDPSLASGAKSGYNFAVLTATGSAFSATATPEAQNVSGDRSFFLDQTGVIRQATGGPADASSSPLQ